VTGGLLLTVPNVALGGRGFSNQLLPHPAILPTLDYPTRSQDGDGWLRPL